MELIIQSLDDMPAAVVQLISYAGNRKILLFEGEIGAGKTTFIQYFCKYFEVKDYVTSPTYSIINEYHYLDRENKARKKIYHMDLYRLKNVQEAIEIGIEDYLFDENYCLIEWPELINDLLPSDTVKIKIEIIENSYRKILFL